MIPQATRINRLPVVAECASKGGAFDDAVRYDSVIDEFLIDLVGLNRQVGFAAFLVTIDIEESFVILAFLDNAGKADGL